jgi:hypothetical protein
MYHKDASAALYKKIRGEQNAYREWLMTLSPAEVLDHCYEYSVREDIVMLLSGAVLPEEQCEALCRLKAPLEAIYGDYAKRENGFADDIMDVIASRVAE